MEFEEAAKIVCSIETKALEYSAPEWEGEPSKRRIEFSPPEFSEMEYEEALTLNERVEKVIAGSEMLMKIYGAEAPAPAAVPAQEKISAAMEAMVPKREEIEAAPPAPMPPEPAIEIEPVKEEVSVIEFEKKKEEKLEFEAEVEEATEERRATVQAPEIKIKIPPILMASPLEGATETVEKIEKQFRSEVKAGKKIDKNEVKKRMLELTRELFREKSTERRDEIKKEIVALKTILSEAGKKGVGAAAPQANIIAVIKNNQEYELAAAKKVVNEAYEEAFAPLVKYFEEEAALGKAADALPAFVSRVEQLKEQVSELASSYEKYLVDKHSLEFEQLEKKGKLREAGEMVKKVADVYAAEFLSLRQEIWSNIDSEVERRKVEVRGGGPAAAFETEEELLVLLQAEEPLEYSKYSRGEIGREEALAEARRIRARKGINRGGG